MSISRRQFCAVMGAARLIQTVSSDFVTAPTEQRLRVIAYNVFAGDGWPSNRPRAKQAVADKKLADQLATELAIYQPDIITFSESPDEKVVKRIAERLKMKYVRFNAGGNWPGTLLSRFEIVDSQDAPMVSGDPPPKELFTRHWGRSTIKLPNGQSLIVHSAHLFPTADKTNRRNEIRAMLDSMNADMDAGRSMILMGDLNLGPKSTEYKLWIDAGWVDTFTRAGKGKGFTMPSDIPKWRVDYVMAAGPIANHIVESKPLYKGAFRLNIADKQAYALSDHLPILAEFKIAK